MKLRRPPSVRAGRACAFTLVEVILALSIAIGILVVALYFHSQVTNLRGQLLDESDRVAAIRLVMDRLTTELRNAFAQPQYGFTGDATSLRFVTAEAPSRATWTASSTRHAAPRTDLRLITYGLSKTLAGTNEIAIGLARTEQLLAEKPDSRSPFAPPSPLDATNAPAHGPEPMTDAIRFIRIWYWDGYGWSATWQSSQLPRGLEISLGAAPLLGEVSPSDYPGELFRRVIYLPTSRQVDDFFDAFDSTGAASTATAPAP